MKKSLEIDKCRIVLIRYDIDLLKFIACVMVVILHGIEHGLGGIQQIIYLLGSFGIPLFFVVNGYLLSQKYIDFIFVNEKLCKYFKIMLLWAVICGTSEYSGRF